MTGLGTKKEKKIMSFGIWPVTFKYGFEYFVGFFDPYRCTVKQR
jgi:hypothetical protein